MKSKILEERKKCNNKCFKKGRKEENENIGIEGETKGGKNVGMERGKGQKEMLENGKGKNAGIKGR